MDLSDREKNAFLARLNGQAGRFETTKLYINKTIEAGIEPSAEEQKLLSIAYSKLQHSLRDSWRVMSALEQEEKTKQDGGHAKLIEKARKDVEMDLENLCDEVLGLVEEKISPNATTDETRLFCLKMKGDYNRYIAECTAEDKRASRTELASTAYGDAVKLAQDRFDAGNPHRMSIVVNAAVFYHDFMNMQGHAIELTESELKKAAEAVADPVDADTRAIMGILQTNLELWKGDEDH